MLWLRVLENHPFLLWWISSLLLHFIIIYRRNLIFHYRILFFPVRRYLIHHHFLLLHHLLFPILRLPRHIPPMQKIFYQPVITSRVNHHIFCKILIYCTTEGTLLEVQKLFAFVKAHVTRVEVEVIGYVFKPNLFE